MSARLLSWCLLLAIGSAVAQEDVAALRLRFVPGEALNYRFIDEQTIRDQAPKSPTIRTRTTSEMSARPLARRGDGWDVLCRFHRVIVEWDGPGGSNQVDSKTPPGRREPEEMSAFRSLVGPGFIVTLGNDGGVLGIASDDPNKPELSGPQGPAQLRRHWAMLTAWTPKGEQFKDGTWGREETLPTGLVDLTRVNRLSVADRSGDRWTIAASMSVSGRTTKSSGPSGDVVVASIRAHEPGSATIVFDVGRGVVESITSEIAFDMFLTHVVRDEETPGSATAMESAQSLSARSSVELLSIDPPHLGN